MKILSKSRKYKEIYTLNWEKIGCLSEKSVVCQDFNTKGKK